jgi:hypothetical protein
MGSEGLANDFAKMAFTARKCSVVEVVPDAAARDGYRRGVTPSRTPPPSCSTTPPIERSASVLLPPARAASLQQKQGNLPKAGARNGESSHKGAENPVQPPPTGNGGRSSGFHSSMPRSNPHARERVMDDRKHLDAVASFVAFAGHETSVASPAGSSRGSVLHAPANRIGDQEMLETSSSGGSPLASSEAPLRRKEVLDSVRSARADDGSRLQRRGKSSPARLALPPARSNAVVGNRSDGKPARRSPGW